MRIEQSELIAFLRDYEVSIEDVMDAVIEDNSLLGVGLVTLKDQIHLCLDNRMRENTHQRKAYILPFRQGGE